MFRSLATAALAAAAAALVAPAARADWGIRAGLEAPIITHVNNAGSYNIGDSFQPSLDLMVQSGPSDFFAIGIEGRIGFASTSNFTRTGESIGPEIMINIPVLPLYVRASLPIRLDPNPVDLELRLAAGLKINLPIVGIYLEAAADMPFVGNDVNGTKQDAFSSQRISIGAGVEIRF